ncbi:MAG: hypothetical protein EBZ48_01535 [Proteobacteria bacterium]|nr:hypothetical protein [Pseudomonadota bacterium]
MRVISDLISGLLIPLRAIRLIADTPKLLLWCCLPFVISVTVYYLLWGTLLAPLRDSIGMAFEGWLTRVLGQSQFATLGSIAQWLVNAVVTLLLFVTMIFSFAWVSNLAALPVNDFVAQATEQALTPPLPRPQSGGFRHETRLLLIDLKKSLISLLGLVVCLVVGWVPIVNLLAIVTAWLLLTYQFISYPQTRRAVGARQGFIALLKNFPISLGFGIAISVGFSIPLLSVFMPPIGVVGGTILFAKLQSRL